MQHKQFALWTLATSATLLADAGNMALSAQSDRSTVHKLAEVEMDSYALTTI